jgi:aryl-alcohol dehydrogenase-like predicted oxidoreductase
VHHAIDSATPSRTDAGYTLIELALAFVLTHPAITCPIIGPYTLAHLESALPAANIALDDDILDRIGEIVPPGRYIGATSGVDASRSSADRRRQR